MFTISVINCDSLFDVDYAAFMKVVFDFVSAGYFHLVILESIDIDLITLGAAILLNMQD